MAAKVYAITMRASYRENMLQKLERLLKRLDLSQGIRPKDLVAVKLHFGEPGNTAYIRPIYLRRVVEAVKALEARPFLTDANTLYVGGRSNAVDHLDSAIKNGFDYAVVGAPLLIADGLMGTSQVEVEVNLEQIRTAYIGRDVAEADGLISVAHFKLHDLAGFWRGPQKYRHGVRQSAGKTGSTLRYRTKGEKQEMYRLRSLR